MVREISNTLMRYAKPFIVHKKVTMLLLIILWIFRRPMRNLMLVEMI